MSNKRQYAKGINPDLLKWCRENVHFSVEDAASYVGVTSERILQWESGEELPTIKQAMKLGKKYHKPWAVFFLPERPNFQVLQDFRSVLAEEKSKWTSRLSIFLNETREQQEWLRDYYRFSSGEENDYIGSWTDLDNPMGLAHIIVEAVKINYEEVSGFGRRQNVFKYYQELVEENTDIFVGKTTAEKIEVSEMRGVYLHDEYAPMVFVNSTDALSAQIFTLFHELAHAFLGQGGVSSIEPLHNTTSGDEAIEVFCNKVASEIVLPTSQLQAIFRESGGRALDIVRNISIQFKVSEELIAIKLNQLGDLSIEDLREIKRLTRIAVSNRPSSSFGNYHLNRYSRNGHLFTKTVLSAYKSGEIMSLDAAKLLNIKTAHIGKQMEYAFS